MKRWSRPSFLVLLLLLACRAQAAECVVLLHGWMRAPSSMENIADRLRAEHYRVANIAYASRAAAIPALADTAVGEGLRACADSDGTHFVTHSMGGLLVRDYFSRHPAATVDRVVMLGPPNQGTNAVNGLLKLPGMRFLLGPAASQLGKGEGFLPARLPPVDFQLGVIAGTRAFNPLLSLFSENPDDGVVTVRDTAVAGMREQCVLPVTHFLMMFDEEVGDEILHFLRKGHFDPAGPCVRTPPESAAASPEAAPL